MTAVRVIPLPDAPLELTGAVEITRTDGELTDRPASPVYLCRCGRPATRPFCDGLRARTGWTGKHA